MKASVILAICLGLFCSQVSAQYQYYNSRTRTLSTKNNEVPFPTQDMSGQMRQMTPQQQQMMFNTQSQQQQQFMPQQQQQQFMPQQQQQFVPQQQQQQVLPQQQQFIPQQPQQQARSMPIQMQAPVKPVEQVRREPLCQNNKPEDVLPHPSNANQFIVCGEAGDYNIMTCPSKLMFNPNSGRCDNNMRTPKGCLSNPCQNNGICTDLLLGKFKCDCPIGWIGDKCEREDFCATSNCGPTGVCIPLAKGSPLKSYCICNNGQAFGTTCDQNVERNPCIDEILVNDHFALRSNPAIFIHCDGHLPNLQFCPWPLNFNVEKQACDWKL